jgi:ribosomal protein L7/L12
MPITVKAPLEIAEPAVEITDTDAFLIRKVRDQLGKIDAIRITRWLTECSLLTCKNFVENLKE